MEIEKGEELGFETILEESDKLVISFVAGWCGKCRLLKPRLRSIARDSAPDIRFVEINIEENPELRDRFDVKHLPTVLSLENQHVVDRTHSVELSELTEFVDNLGTLLVK